MTILKLSLTGFVAIRASHRVLSAEPLGLPYGVERAHESRYPNLCVLQERQLALEQEKEQLLLHATAAGTSGRAVTIMVFFEASPRGSGSPTRPNISNQCSGSINLIIRRFCGMM